MVWWEPASESKSYWSCKYRPHLAHFAGGSTTSASEKSVSTSLAGPSAGFGPEDPVQDSVPPTLHLRNRFLRPWEDPVQDSEYPHACHLLLP